MNQRKSSVRPEMPHQDHHGISGRTQRSKNAVEGTTTMKRTSRVRTQSE
jgi:hypothetical protein